MVVLVEGAEEEEQAKARVLRILQIQGRVAQGREGTGLVKGVDY